MLEESKNKENNRNRPLLARTAIFVNASEDKTDEELAEEESAGHWTAATYTSGPNGTIVDTPAGLDF